MIVLSLPASRNGAQISGRFWFIELHTVKKQEGDHEVEETAVLVEGKPRDDLEGLF